MLLSTCDKVSRFNEIWKRKNLDLRNEDERFQDFYAFVEKKSKRALHDLFLSQENDCTVNVSTKLLPGTQLKGPSYQIKFAQKWSS
jgi:hypothetical protein